MHAELQSGRRVIDQLADYEMVSEGKRVQKRRPGLDLN